MFIAPNKLHGTVLFNTQDLQILRIEGSAIQSDNGEQVYDDIPNIPMVQNYGISALLGPRYPEFILVSRSSMPQISDEKMNEIEELALSVGFGGDLQRVSQILKCHKGRERNSVDCSNLFLAAQLRDNGTVQMASITGLKLEITGNRFDINTINNAGDSNFLSFISEFENITLEIGDKFQTAQTIAKIKNRMSMNGRVSPHYVVVRSHGNNRNQIKFRDIPMMKIEEMLTFFGHLKKSQTKVETLADCFRGWSQKYVRSSEIALGKIFFIQLSTKANALESPFDILPVDFILSHGSNFRILSSEAVDKDVTRIIAQVVDKPVDDMAQMLYTMMESNTNARGINILGFNDEIIKKLIESLKSEMVKAKVS